MQHHHQAQKSDRPRPRNAAIQMAATQAATDQATEAIKRAAVYGRVDAVNSGDLDVIDRAVDKYYAKDHVVHTPSLPATITGPEDMKQAIRAALTPAFHGTVEDVITEGDIVASRITITGLDPKDPTAKVTVLNISRFKNGQYAEEWELP